MTRPVLGWTIFAILCLAKVEAQDDATFKSDSTLVEVYAVVLDHSNKPVEGLTRNQFEIRDNGHLQPIRIFESSDKTVSCALLLDTTGSMAASMPSLRNAARTFIEALRPSDSASISSFNDHVEELSAMTDDKAAARRSLARLRAGGRTALFDSISQTALAMEKRPGKKAIVVLTDGGDNASVLNRQSAVQRARKAGVPIFAVAVGEALSDSAAASLLRELAESTGGRMYKANRAKDMEEVFTAIAADLDKSYLLAFQPSSDSEVSKWHQLEISVKDLPKPVRIRARAGYSSQ